MPGEQSTGYLPGDPRYGLQGEALKDYYRTKPAQWAIYCWDKPGMEATRRALLVEQNSYVKNFGDSVIFRGPIRSADGAHNIGTALLLELPNRAAADRFWNEEPFARNGGYQRDARITRWVFGD